MSLYFSLRIAALPIAIGVAFAAFAVSGHTWAWVVVGGFVLFALLSTRRIDLSPSAISFVALLPLLGRQSLAWVDLGPFEQSTPLLPYDFVKAPVTGASRFRLLWLVPSRTVTVATVFARSPLGPRLTGTELVALTASVRGD